MCIAAGRPEYKQAIANTANTTVQINPKTQSLRISLPFQKYNKPLPWPAGDTGAGEGLLAYSITGQEKVFEFAGVTVNMLVDTAHVMQEIPVFGS